MLPYTCISVATIQEIIFKWPLLILLDSGSTTSWFNSNALIPGIHQTVILPLEEGVPMAGTFKLDQQVTLSQFQLSGLIDKVYN